MEKKPVFKIDIPSPCSQSWDEMSPAKQGRFCGQCTKTIIDFTTWDDKDIAQYIRGSKEKICGRFTDDQLNRNLLHEQKERANALVPALLISTALAVGIAGTASANGNSVADKPLPVQVDSMKVNAAAADTTISDIERVPAAKADTTNGTQLVSSKDKSVSPLLLFPPGVNIYVGRIRFSTRQEPSAEKTKKEKK